MPRPGLHFTDPQPPERALTTRADIALFAGLVARRESRAPDWVKRQLDQAGWAPPWRTTEQVDALLDVPVMIESMAQFEALFLADARPFIAGQPDFIPTALGAAVRSFFAEGGRRCYVVRCGDPLPLMPEPNAPADAHRLSRLALVDRLADTDVTRGPLIPGWKSGLWPMPDDRKNWHGAGHIFGLDDATMIALPDLPDLLAAEPRLIPETKEPEEGREIFHPAGSDLAAPARPRRRGYQVTAARFGEAQYKEWASAIGAVLSLLGATRGGSHRRDVTLIAGLPLPLTDDMDAERDVLRLIEPLAASRQLQIAYPWIATATSATMPEGLENPEGAFAGVLARNALRRGAFRSAASLPMTSVRGMLPLLDRHDIEPAQSPRADWTGDRVSLIGRDDRGFRVLSDATNADERVFRAGGVSRLVGILIRAGRIAGEELVFEASRESTWTRLRRRIEEFLTELWQLGALDGATPGEAFQVRCGPTTMTEADIGAGRLIAEISVVAAQPIERITVTLTIGGRAPEALGRAA